MADTFCLYPFKALNITPIGSAKVCCAFSGNITKDGRPMSVYEHSVEDIWNSDEMRDIRRAMIAGEHVSACNYCYEQEEKGLQSLRNAMTDSWRRELGVTTEVCHDMVRSLCSTVEANDFRMADRSEWLDLDVGNLCNLKCRMCTSYASSSIGADRVHSRWAPQGIIAARWKGRGMAIAPDVLLGVAAQGIAWPVTEGGTKVGWTEGRAAWRFSATDADLDGVSVQISGRKPDDHPLKLTVNGDVVFDGALPPGPWQGTFSLPSLSAASDVEILLESPVFVHPDLGRPVGVGVEEVKLLRKTGAKNDINASRFLGRGVWYQEPEFFIGELLARADQITRMRLIGGEPFLIKEVLMMMRHLVETGSASNISLAIVTNGTAANDEILDLLKCFKSSCIAISIDGVDTVNDYIRYPSKWDEIDRNLDRFRQVPNTVVFASMTLQAYNVLNIADVIRYTLAKQIGFQFHLLQYPQHLATALLPQSVRQLAAERLLAFVKEEEARLSLDTTWACLAPAALSGLAAAIAAPTPPGNDQLLRDFIVFTNDLDASRTQTFAAALPELATLMSDAGINWTQEQRFFQLTR